MKIGVLSSHTPSLFWFRMDMMRDFKQAGCDVVAFGNEPEELWKAKFGENGIGYRQITVERNGTNPFHDIKTLSSIKRALREERPDKVFCYQAKTVIYGSSAAHSLGIESYSLIAGLGSLFLSNGLKQKLARLIMCSGYKRAFRNNSAVFFQNHDDSRELLTRKLLDEKKIIYINGSGVNTESFVPTEMPDNPCFLYIGRLIRDKGISEYLDACRILKSKLPDIRCMLVGPLDSNPSAITEEELNDYIRDGTVEYYGEQSDVRPYLNQCSVFVLPSYHEGTPKTVLEAMASGRAVITTDAPGCRETVEDGINGFLVPVKNVNELAECMYKLACSPQTQQAMGLEGRKMAINKFDVHNVNAVIMKAMKIGE